MISHLLTIELGPHEIVDHSVLVALRRSHDSGALLHHHLRVDERLTNLVLLKQSWDIDDFVFNIDLVVFRAACFPMTEDIIYILHSKGLLCS